MDTLELYDTADTALRSLSRDRIEAIQSHRFAALVQYVYASSMFWRKKFQDAGIKPQAISHIRQLSEFPTTDRSELQQDQAANPPFGSYICSASDTWSRFFSTSGTTGRPLRRVFSKRDWDLAIKRFRRRPMVKSGDRLMILGPIDALMGPTAAYEAASDGGALPIPAGLWGTEKKIQTMLELRPVALAGVVSYVVHLTEVAAELGLDLAEAGVRRITSAGEPGANVEGTQRLVSERFGGARLLEGYGMTELFPLGGGCEHSSSIHLSEDMVAVECLKPGTVEPVPPGELGELVYTNLIGDTQPLIRYRSGDLGRLTDSEVCPCGHTHRRIVRSVEGRVDDMIWYRGVNFFPTAVEQVVRSINSLGSEYAIRIQNRPGALEVVSVSAEISPQAEETTVAVENRLRDALRTAIGVSIDVEIVPPATLPRPGGRQKAKRVIREDADDKGRK